MARAAVERVGERGGRVRVGVAELLDAERLAGRAALGAALVVAAGGVDVLGAGVERDEPPVAEVERHGGDVERGEVDPDRLAVAAAERGELVEQAGLRADPVVLDPRAELRQLDAVGLGRAGDREQREARAPPPARRRRRARSRPGRRRRTRSARPASGTPVARSSATVPRTNARQPSARPGSAAAKRSCSPRSRASATISPSSRASASAVTPRSIANGSARPPL